jgi:hypothetical protein
MALQAELAAASAASTIDPPAPASNLGLEALLAAGDDAAAAFVDAVRNAGRDAARTFLDVADPRFVLAGSLQPVFLGIPFGDPEAEVELTISKAGVGMRVGFSIIGLLSDACENITVGFCKLLTFPLGLLYQDFVVASFELPGVDVLDALVDGTPEEAFDAASVWGVTLEGSVGMLGMKMVELSGLVVPPGNRDFVDQRTQRLDQGKRFDPADTSRPVPIVETEHYDNLVRFGGLVVTGNLRAPELLVDPIGLFERLDLELPDNPLEIPEFLATIAQSLGDEVSPGFVQMYVPGEPLAVPNATHIVAEWNVDVLSLPITDGTLSVTSDGAELIGFFPYVGAQGRVIMQPAAIVDGLPVPVSFPDPVGAFASILSGEPSTVVEVPDPSVPLDESAFADVFDVDAIGPAPANAYLLALLSGGVYVEAHEPGGFVDGFAAEAHDMGLGDVTFIENALTDTELVAARSDDATVFVFRGTEPSDPGVDGLVDATFAFRNQPTPAGTVAVHSGFWQAVDSVYDDVVDYIEAGGDRRVWLTGHSLGGSLAVVTALRLAADGYDVAGVQSIGAPNAGGQSFTAVVRPARASGLARSGGSTIATSCRCSSTRSRGTPRSARPTSSCEGDHSEPGDTFVVRLDTDDPRPVRRRLRDRRSRFCAVRHAHPHARRSERRRYSPGGPGGDDAAVRQRSDPPDAHRPWRRTHAAGAVARGAGALAVRGGRAAGGDRPVAGDGSAAALGLRTRSGAGAPVARSVRRFGRQRGVGGVAGVRAESRRDREARHRCRRHCRRCACAGGSDRSRAGAAVPTGRGRS